MRRGLAALCGLALCCAIGQAAETSPASRSPSPPAMGAGGTLASVADRLKAHLSWDPLTGSGWFERSGDRLSFAIGLSRALWNFQEILSLDPPLDSAQGPRLSEQAVALMESRFKAASAARGDHFSVTAILIDPGHGGKDTGAIGEHSVDGKKFRVLEKDIALDVAHRVYDSLRGRYPDKRILLSREGDSYPTLEQRVEMANSVDTADNEAILYVSIHANASFNKNARGFEVWYLNPEYRRTVIDGEKAKSVDSSIAPILNAMLEEEFTTESIILARDIVKRLQANIGEQSPNRGLRAEEWFVVRNAKMPSVLVEMGFVTNPDEARLLSTGDYLKKVSDGIYTGLIDFLGDFEKQRGPAKP